VSTSHGFGIFDLVHSKVVYSTAVSIPSGNFTAHIPVFCVSGADSFP